MIPFTLKYIPNRDVCLFITSLAVQNKNPENVSLDVRFLS